MARESPDKGAIRVKRDMLIKIFEKIDSLNKEILALMAQGKATDEDQDAEFSTINEYGETECCRVRSS